MKEEYRISRNVRLAWFLSKLNQVIRPTLKAELLNSENELDVLSILPKGWQPDDPPSTLPYQLVPSTRVTFLARRYRFIIELDLSPSTGIVDDSTGEMIFDEVFHALTRCLAGLARPFKVPGTDLMFQPEIFITILAYSSIIGLSSHQVLVQGCQLLRTDLDHFLQHIYQQLRAVENNIAEVLQQQHHQARGQSDGAILCPGITNDMLEDQPHRKPGVSMVTADVGLVSMVRQGILALQLLPPNSSAGIIIITDGVTSVPDVAVCETLLNQLRSGTIACSFVQVGGAYSYDCSFGYIPNVELMKFISLATFGSYMSTYPELDLLNQDMNTYHKAFLTYSFLKTGESMNPEYYCVSQHKLFNEHLVSASGNPALAMRRKKHTEKEVHAQLVSVVSVRLREGYTIREVNFTKGSTQLEVKLVLLWKHNMRIEYLAVASWPLEPTNRTTWVEVTMEGSYDILHDISCTMRKPISSPYRTSVIRRFWNTLQSINQTDQMLVHLQSFNSIPEHYTIPESTKNGVPLFYIPPGSTTPVLSLQHSGSKDSRQSQFASYWKPILSMDANFWQRWLHMHRIAIILEHDLPVPKHLHSPGGNGRFSTIQCRISHSALTSLLRDCSSFVLVEGYSYVKLIYSSPDQPPTSFYLVRLISKAPCMVLRLGFPIGTLAHTRNKIVDELRDQILKLRFPHRVQNKEATPKVKRKILGNNNSPSKSPPLPTTQPPLSDRPCVVVLNKPLEKLLIRYEKLPSDYRTPFILNMENFAQTPNVSAPLTVAASRTASSTLASLSRYFLHQRWVWAVQACLGPTVPLPAVAQILSILSEIRLSEGFHFAASGEGIVNMVTELPMKSSSAASNGENHTCIVQYILFPPHSTSTKDSFSTDDDNDTEVEAIDVDTELNLVTECWIEPQSGAVSSPSANHRHLQGLTYQEIPHAIFPRDQMCMSTMLTFEYLSQLCQNKDHVYPICGVKGTGGDSSSSSSSDCIHTISFQFDLMKLLPKCQQIEIFFLTLSRVEEEDSFQNTPSLPNELLLSLFHGCLQQDLSDREIPLADSDYVTFMQHILQREQKTLERQDTVMSFHTIGSSKEVTGSTSTLQSFGNAELADEDAIPAESETPVPQWKCYAKYINPQQIFLTFLPATFTDVQILMASSLDKDAQRSGCLREEDPSHEEGAPPSQNQAESSATSAVDLEDWAGRVDEQENGTHVSADRDLLPHSQQSDPSRPRCPVYIYNCSLEALREQLVHPQADRQPRDIFFRSLSQERTTSSSWTDLMAHPHKQKELANFCSLLQEHYHQSYVKGVYRSLQQSYSISSQDVLTAMDYCEESLQEIDITCFLQTLCGHIRVFREGCDQPGTVGPQEPSGPPATFTIGVGEAEEEGATVRGPLVSTSSVETEDISEAESRGRASAPTSPLASEASKSNKVYPEFPLSLLQMQHNCEVYPDLHRIIQDKFMEIGAQYFKTVPANPHYFFYCPPSAKKEEDSDREEQRRPSEDIVSEAELATEDENVSGCCIVTESDTDLEVEYRERADREFPDNESLSDSNTVNQDEDSFSILEGDSLLEPEGPQQEMPPLFVHLTCSVNVKNCHGSMPIQTLPTCLGEVITCLENAESLQSVDLGDLSVTLDIFVLTLPLEIEVMASDIHHNRSHCSENALDMNKRLMTLAVQSNCPIFLCRLSGDPLSKLPVPHKQAVLATMDEIRWLLEDEMVSALRHSKVISTAMLQKVADHVYRSPGRPQCHCEVVPLQFVFGPEQSLEKFKEVDRLLSSCISSQEFRRMSLSGYLLNGEWDSFYYVSVSRLHSNRLQTARKLSERSVSVPGTQAEETGRSSQQANHCTEGEEMRRASLSANQSLAGRGLDAEVELLILGFLPRVYDRNKSIGDYIVKVNRAYLKSKSKHNIASFFFSAAIFFLMMLLFRDVFVFRFAPRRSELPAWGSCLTILPGRLLRAAGPANQTARLPPSERSAGLSRCVVDECGDVCTAVARYLCYQIDDNCVNGLGRAGKLSLPVFSPTGNIAWVLNQHARITIHPGAELLHFLTSHSTYRKQRHVLLWGVEFIAAICALSPGSGKLRPSRVQSVVSSQGSLDSDMLGEDPLCSFPHHLGGCHSQALPGLPVVVSTDLPRLNVTPSHAHRDPDSVSLSLSLSGSGYDGGSSDSECEGATMNEQELQCPLMPDFWLIVKIYQDRVEVYSHSRYITEALRLRGTFLLKMGRKHIIIRGGRKLNREMRRVAQLEEGEVGTLHSLFQGTCQQWLTFMAKLGCPSIQQGSAEIASQFLLPSVLTEIVNLVASLASDTTVKVFERISCPQGECFMPLSLSHHPSTPPATARHFILIGRNFHQWHCSTEQAHKGFQRFEALEPSDSFGPGLSSRALAPRQRLLLIHILDKKVTLYTYNWSVDLGVSVSRGLVRLVQWQNARSHVVHCLLSQKMGLFHHYCFSDTPTHEDPKQEPNPFLNSTLEAEALLRSPIPPPSKDQGRLSSAGRSLPPLHFPPELVPFDEALRDVSVGRPILSAHDAAGNTDTVARHGAQLLDIKAMERREMEKQMKIENLFVTWQQRSAQSNMPITVADLDTLKQSSRLVHYCATPLLFDPVFRKQIQEEQTVHPQIKKRHRSSDSTASGRDRSHSCDSVEMLPSRLKDEPWLLDISNTFLQQYVQYLQSMGFILVQVRPPSPARSTARARAAAFSSMGTEGRASFSFAKQKSEESPKSGGAGAAAYHLQRALPGGIVLMELAFQGCYFCVKQYALECSRIPMGQSVNSQLSMLFTEECDKVRDLMHVHSFSYDFHLRVVHQYLLGCHMTLRQGYQLTSFLEDFIAHHPDIPKFGRNHVFQGSFSLPMGLITAHQLYNYITDHAGTYGMKPLRMSKSAMSGGDKKGAPSTDLHEYALVALWNSSGSYKDLEGLRHHDDFDVSLLVCHNAAPFEEQSEGERHLLRLRYYVIMTSQRELFPRLTADMRRFKKLPQIHREPSDLGGKFSRERAETGDSRELDLDPWEEGGSDSSEFYSGGQQGRMAPGLFYSSPLFPLLASEVTSARKQIQTSVQQAMGHCRRDNLWRRLFHGEHLASDKLKLSKLSFVELEELLNAVQSRLVGEIDPQLDCFLTMSPGWYQSLIKVLLSRFPQSCRHFVDADSGIQYLAVLNQKFTDCFVLVFLNSQAGKTSLKVVFREPLPSQPQPSNSPPPQLVSMYHHLESVINTACFNLWTGLL
ncbi:SZT2 protein, partial [Amia calva]|nr:SZT2 protein [Amia calva]